MHLLVFVYALIQNVKMNRIYFNTFEWKGGGGWGWGRYIQGAYSRMYFFLQVDGPMTGWGGGGYKYRGGLKRQFNVSCIDRQGFFFQTGKV